MTNPSPPPRVFVTRRIPEAGLAKLRKVCQVDVWEDSLPPSREALIARAAGCVGLLTLLSERVDGDLLDAVGPQLKVVSNYAVGVNNIDIAACTARGVRVGNTPGVLTEATADMALTLMLAAARRLVESNRTVHAGAWHTWDPMGFLGVDLQGKTLGIVGLGAIGQAVGKRCRFGWDMKIVYADPRRKPEAEGRIGANYLTFEQLLTQSDFISVHTPLTPATAGMFNLQAFRRMKKTAVFVNTARGGVVVQADLVQALREGAIFAAGLDVTDPEPPLPNDPILELPNVVIAPHIASATTTTRTQMAEIAADNLLAGLADRALRCWVNRPA